MGATASMLWWPEVVCETLATAGYQVIRFDHRDTGASTTGAPGAPDYDIDDMADDLIAILNAYEVTAAHLVGMSLGGYLSQLVAARHPARVISLTLMASEPIPGTTYEGPGIAPGFMAHFSTMETLDWSDRPAVREFLLEIARLSAGWAHPFDATRALARINAELDRTDIMQSAFNHALLAGKVDDSLTIAAIHQPVLVIHGSADPVIPLLAGEAIAAVVPHTRMIVLNGSGHEIAAPDVPRITAAILDFIGGL
jgi:pimeloyl-ACP methyl ester carboxylesterase